MAKTKTLKQLQAEQARLEKAIERAKQKEINAAKRQARTKAGMVLGLFQLVMIERYRYDGDEKVLDVETTNKNAADFIRYALDEISHDRSIFKNLTAEQQSAIYTMFNIDIEDLIAEYEPGFTFEKWKAEKKARNEQRAAEKAAAKHEPSGQVATIPAPSQPSDGVATTASDAALEVLKTLTWDADALYWKYSTPDGSKMKHTGFTAEQRMEMTEYIMRKY